MKEEAANRVEDTRIILEFFGFDAERSNERSALVLLSLLHLNPEEPWENAKAPMLGTRAIMRKYLTLIAWETEVWCADDPTHLIHFNGERFLGPYE